MHNHIFRLVDAAAIVEQKTGQTIADIDADSEPVILMSADLADLKDNGVAANTVYFGDFVIQSYNAGSVEFGTKVNSVTSASISVLNTWLPIGNVLPCVTFDTINEYTDINAHFYGWKFTLQP